MKKLLTLLLITFSLTLFAQTTKIVRNDTTFYIIKQPKLTPGNLIPEAVSADPLSSILPQITPKSPNMAAFERFGVIPVSLNVGLAELSIPIFDIKIGNITIPIKLSAHLGGNKVGDNASSVGQSWALIAGGSAGRMVKGKPDENEGVLANGIYNLDPYVYSISCLTENLLTKLDYISVNTDDNERDIFSVSSPTKNNTFVMTSPTKPFWLKPDSSKISFTMATNSIQSIKLTDEMGNNFTYGARETSGGYGSAWHMTEIQGKKPTEKVVFTYQNNQAISALQLEDADIETYMHDIGGLNPISASNTFTNADISSLLDIKLLNQIDFPNGKLVFSYTDNRQDNLGKSLTSIDLYSFNPNIDGYGNAGYSLIKKFQLNQSYKDGRLFLDGVDLKDNLGNTIGSYTCEYNTTPLPAKNSKAKDYWGFSNGQTSNTTLIPAQTFSTIVLQSQTTPTVFNVGGANRSPNETQMQARVLNKITYPTGGFTNFEYEAHRHDGGQLAGGLRIKKTISDDGNGKTITKTYKYGLNESGDGIYRNVTPFTYKTTQSFDHPPVPFSAENSPERMDYNYKQTTFSSAYITPQSTSEGSPVTYNVVAEYEDNGTGANGKTIYEYEQGNDDNLLMLTHTAKTFLRSQDWTRGQLLSKTIFGADGKKKYKQINSYQTLQSGNSANFGYLTAKSKIQLSYYYEVAGCIYNYNEYTPMLAEYWHYGVKKLSKSEEFFYDDTDEDKYVYKKAETDYNPYYQPSEVRVINSDGDTRIKKYRYITDFNNLTLPALTGNALAYSKMKENNDLATPIEELSLRKYASDNSIRVLGGKFTNFQVLNFASHNYTLPDSLFLLEIPESPTVSIGSFTNANVNASKNVVKDSRYANRISFDNYDSYGNLLDYKIDGGIKTSFTYSSTALNNILHTFPISETQNAAGDKSLTTNFYFNYPLIGVSRIQAPNDLNTYFEYDDFARLSQIKDDSGYVMKAYQYFYGANSRTVEQISLKAMTSITGDYKSFITNTSYFDGLGRPLQKVQKYGSGDGLADIVTEATEYNNFGQVLKSYVPYSNVGAGAKAAYAASFEGDTKPYATTTEFDNSPMNRPKKQLGPGQDWHTNNNFVESQYKAVDASDNQRKYSIVSGGGNVDGNWGSYKLSKNITISEKLNQVIEYKDNEGKLIQKDVQEGTGNYLSTYYLYDDFDRLKYVIQPKLYQKNENFTASDSLIFAYKYDKRSRIVEKLVPGAEAEYTVFDKWDRPVMSQTALQRLDGDKWSFVKYDGLSRVLIKGDVEPGLSHTQLQDAAMANGLYEEVRNSTLPYYSLNKTTPDASSGFIYVANYYDKYDNFRTTSNPPLGFESGYSIHAEHSNTNGLLTGQYIRNLENFGWLKYANYYDRKSRLIQSRNQHHLAGNEADITGITYNFSGNILEQKILRKKLGAADLTEINTHTYDHANRLTGIRQQIDNLNQSIVAYDYDGVGRTKVKYIGTAAYSKSVTNGDWGNPAVWNKNTLPGPYSFVQINNQVNVPDGYFADIGSVSVNGTVNFTGNGQIRLNTANTQLLQKVDYSYHIRSGLLGINLNGSNAPEPNTAENDLFSYKLTYDLDGNINKQEWKHKGSELKSYTFTYDGASRLKSASYAPNTENFGLAGITYDNNGNIKTLQRYGTGGGLVDDLEYTYQGNRLRYVKDKAGTDDHVGDFVPRTSGLYTYQPNGNLLTDNNERITGINYYTFLNQPNQIDVSTLGNIKYKYDGAGMLFKTIYTNSSNSVIETWDYLGNLIYKTGALYQVANPEGRAYYENSKWNYEYFLTDHLGNVRSTFTTDGVGGLTQKSINDFDPLGVRNNVGLANNTVNRFELQGKERDETFGLRRVNFGARSYNPTIGRLDKVDNFADKYDYMSSYQYCANNPLRFTEVNGDSLTMSYFDAGGNSQKINYGFTESGGYGFYHTDGSAYRLGTNDFVDKTEGALAKLGLGAAGRRTIDFISGNEQTVTIGRGNKNDFNDKTNTVGFNPNSKNQIPTENGLENPISYISLGHELGHAEDKLFGGLNTNKTWNGYAEAEKYASHKENLFRGENGLSLRTTYGIMKDNATNLLSPDFNSKIIDKNGNSLFYKPINYRKR